MSRDTLWRAIRSGQLPATLSSGRGGRQYQVFLTDVMVWKASFAGASDTCGTPATPCEAPAEVAADTSGASDTSEAWQAPPGLYTPAHLEALRMLEAAHQDLRRLERQSTALTFEIHMYRKSLTEQAESLAEKEALRQQSDHQANELAAARERLAEMEQQLLEASGREQAVGDRWSKIPRWVRRCFGAA